MKDKENSITLLNLIYKNAQMGLIGIDTVLKKIENDDVAHLVAEQREEYEEICRETSEILSKYGTKEEEINKLKELSTKMMSEMMTLNADDKKIVKMMMSGNERGVIEIQEKLNIYSNSDSDVTELAKKLLATEEHNREEFKKYL